MCASDTVGCFKLPHTRSPLQKVPESPKVIDTRFYLFRRSIPSSKPQRLHYEDHGVSLNKSSFDPKQPLKMVVHGYLNRWNEPALLESGGYYMNIVSSTVVFLHEHSAHRHSQLGFSGNEQHRNANSAFYRIMCE